MAGLVILVHQPQHVGEDSKNVTVMNGQPVPVELLEGKSCDAGRGACAVFRRTSSGRSLSTQAPVLVDLRHLHDGDG